VPQTGSMLELQFLRLLSKLERIVVELDVHSQQSPLKFHSVRNPCSVPHGVFGYLC
jgi:hypothetical protein